MKFFALEIIRNYARKASWFLGLIILITSLYIGYEAWFYPNGQFVLGRLNLGIHELGHLAAGFSGNEFFGFLGGTLGEIFAPLLGLYMFRKQQDYLGILFAMVWLSSALFDVSAYMDSAKDPYFTAAVPIWAQGGEVQHDWTYLFTEMGVLEYYHQIAMSVRVLAAVIYVWGIGMMFWVVGEMFYQKYLHNKKLGDTKKRLKSDDIDAIFK